MGTERKIGAHVYRCDKMPAAEALSLFLRVTKLFRAAPGMLASFATSTKEAKAAFLTLCLGSEIDPSETIAILTEIIGTCRVGSDPCVVGVKPQSFEDMIDVAWFGLEVQFGDFLRASLA